MTKPNLRGSQAIAHFKLGIMSAIIILSAGFARAEGAFRVTSPSYWKKTSHSEGDVYRNTKSKKNESVLIRSFPLLGQNTANFEYMKQRQAGLEEMRLRFFQRTGVRDFAVLDYERKKLKDKSFPEMVVLRTRMKDPLKREVQMLERHYFAKGRMFQVVYMIEDAGINDLGRVASIMDNFKPIASKDRMPAQETVGQESSAARKARIMEHLRNSLDPNEVDDASLPTSLFPENMPEIKRRALCASVPPEHRRESLDPEAVTLSLLRGGLNGCAELVRNEITWENFQRVLEANASRATIVSHLRDTAEAARDSAVQIKSGVQWLVEDGDEQDQVRAALGQLILLWAGNPGILADRVSNAALTIASQTYPILGCLKDESLAMVMCKSLKIGGIWATAFALGYIGPKTAATVGALQDARSLFWVSQLNLAVQQSFQSIVGFVPPPIRSDSGSVPRATDQPNSRPGKRGSPRSGN